jgi:hypothetical protein
VDGGACRQEGQRERSEEALATRAEEIAACPFCLIMLDDGVKELGKVDQVSVRDIAAMLAEQLVGHPLPPGGAESGIGDARPVRSSGCERRRVVCI